MNLGENECSDLSKGEALGVPGTREHRGPQGHEGDILNIKTPGRFPPAAAAGKLADRSGLPWARGQRSFPGT